MTTITKERLLTIRQWRETYGPGSNVVLPAEEAEELARIALASLEQNVLSGNSPLIPGEVLSAIREVARIRADFDDFDGDRRGIGDCLDEAEQELIVTINKYASQLAAEPIAPNDVREQTAIPQVPVTPDGWISCSERMPNTKTAVLVAVEFDRKGDWRMKWATYIPGHPDANDGWIIPGASWKPSHWMPLPEPPQEVNQ
ncbi:DUF551 domain-containing protein [Escherichia coli]|uniref:DUF551 domain-containing protein n=2 Tax=Enterobacterales TaxID=91347 RepID=UPI0006A14BEC|nr:MULTISPECIES: DUF551 domain-containing protein [Enterobacteriaceae]AMU85610.1 hypothetical protein Y979_26125 [Escherichia coli str. Sanji]ATW99994.1 DUF551 domain-containing protein [Escherichia coli]ATX22312.1 DUF551 domain-containing protein [Escherichia coli]AUL66459.1 hypothetical protein BVL38_27175 [Escherichia coli]AUV51079.1 DUF551 domain-containing protein [Escherichia coli]